MPSKARATHQGECQICGRVQKLPNDLLSQHGYKVLNNFFSGVCPGSKQQPYERSCDLIREILPSLNAHLVGLHSEVVDLFLSAVEPECFNYVWVKNAESEGRGSYQWKQGTLTIEEKNNGNGYYWKQIIFVVSSK
jgi:hypothetical protein